jgi:ribosomal-protein-alanine N-acetyltransferase
VADEGSHDELRTVRLSLRRPVASDVDAIFALHRDPRAVRYNPSDSLTSRGQAVARVESWQEHWQRHGFGYWVVRRRDDPQPLGVCGLKVMELDGGQVLNLLYRLDPACWGDGLATEAASAVVAWAARSAPDRLVVARVRPDNLASQQVAVHAGLVRAEHLDRPGEDGPDWIYASATPGIEAS